MGKKNEKAAAQRKQRKAMKKRSKDKQRQKTSRIGAMSENAVQHQMLSEFGNVQNFVRNVLHLSTMLQADEDLKALRFVPEQVYAQFDLAVDREQLADLYAQADDLPAYDEQYEEYWHDKRRDVLPDLVTDEFVEQCEKVFKKLLITKKGFKKDYRGVMAGNLLVQSHTVALSRTEAPLEDNNLWELILLASLKENPRELPEPVPEAEESVSAAEATPSEPEPAPEAEEGVSVEEATPSEPEPVPASESESEDAVEEEK